MLQLEASYPASLPVDTLMTGLQLAGIKLTREVLIKELHYLTDKSLLESSPSPLDVSNLRYKLTALGVDHIELQNLSH